MKTNSHGWCLALAAGILCLCGCGTTARQGVSVQHDGSGVDYADGGSAGSGALAHEYPKLIQMRESADLLLTTEDWVHIEIVRSKASRSSTSFSVSEMRQLFPIGSLSGVRLVVMEVPRTRIVESNDSTIDRFLSQMDGTLRQAGAQEVVFQCRAYGFLVQIHP